jgi:septal ring-binding cell division protein DamX
MAKAGRAGLGLWDRVVLLLAWGVTCGLVYLLGFYVGKGMQERPLGPEDRLVRLPVVSTPPPAGQRPKAESDLTFYDTLAGSERTLPHPPHDAPAAPTPTPTPGPATPTPAPAAPVAPPAAVAAPAPHPPRPKEVATTSEPAPPVPHPAPAATAAPVPPAPSAPPATRPAGGSWTVLANPTRNHDEADGLVRQLRSRGYDATLVRVLRDGDTWYRVLVGHFATAGQATETMQRLREHEGVAHAFVASE